MSDLLANVIPILFLIAFGMLLRRVRYFEDVAIQRLTNMVANLLVPCVIFTTILNLEVQPEHLLLTLCFALYQGLLLGLSWAVYKAFHIKRRFFPFYSCAFAFGFMSMPLFSTVFGAENMGYLVAMGVGQELFVALIFIPGAKLYLKNEKTSGKKLLKTLTTPLFFMILGALLLKFTGLQTLVAGNVVGQGLLEAIAKLGSLTSVLTMLIVGYRISFRSRARMKESLLYVLFRYALTCCVGYLLKLLLLDGLSGGSPYFDYAFFTLLSQHGSVVLTVFVGEYGSQEDLEVASNAFVINVIVGILLYVGFVYGVGAGCW